MIIIFLYIQAPVAVGITALSSEDMYMSAGHGKCVEILHVIGDTLCQLGKPPLRPNLGPVNIDGDNDKLEDTSQINEETNDSNDESLADAINDLEINNERVTEIEDPSEVIYNIIYSK